MDTAERRRANIARLLRPRSIAFIGGANLAVPIAACRSIGFEGEMWVVNPRREEVSGIKCHADVRSLPGVPDAAFIAVNAAATPEVLRDLAEKGAGGAVCYAAGFAEMGAEGRTCQDALVTAAGDLAVLGPNCYGILNYLEGAALWADAHGGKALESGVAVVSQSGNISLNLTMTERQVPLAQVIAVGNQAVLSIGDFIEPLLEDPRIKAIGLYIEGLSDIASFSRAALKALEAGIPLLALKVGSSAMATRIAASHTASLAGEDALHDTLFRRLGIIRAPSLTAFMETLKLLAYHGPLEGGRLGVLTCSGGDAALLADAAERNGLTIPPLEPAQEAIIAEQVTAITTIANPLDYNTAIWGQPEKLETCFGAVMSAPVDATALVIDYCRPGLPGYHHWDSAVAALIDAARRTGKLGLLLATFPELLPEPVRARAVAAGLVPLQGLEDAIFALGGAHWLHKRRREILAEGSAAYRLPRLAALGAETRTLDEWDSKQALAHHGLPLPPGRRIARAEVPAAAEALGYPLVLKAVRSDLTHKSEAGAVALGLGDAAAVEAALEAMADLSDSFILERMVGGAVAEIIVGVKRDPVLGLALVLGAGGVLVNLVEDSARLLLPTTAMEIETALAGLKVAKLLEGYRGKPAGDRRALVAAIQAIAAYAEANAESLKELDVNPLLVLPEGQGVVAVDALIMVTL